MKLFLSVLLAAWVLNVFMLAYRHHEERALVRDRLETAERCLLSIVLSGDLDMFTRAPDCDNWTKAASPDYEEIK